MKSFSRQILTTLIAVSALSTLTACGRQLPQQAMVPNMVRTQQAAQALPQTLIVRFQPDASRMELQAFNQRYQLQTEKYLPELNAYVLVIKSRITSQAALTQMVNQIAQESVIQLVEINQTVQAGPAAYDMHVTPIF